MTVLNYVQMNIVPVVILAVIYYDMKKRLVKSDNNVLLGKMTLTLISLLLADTLGWIHNGLPGRLNHYAVWIFNMLYYALMGILPYQWVIYSSRRMRGGYGRHALSTMAIFAVPLVAYLVLLLLTPQMGLFFTVDESNIYHRGSYLVIQQAICVFYIILSSTMAFLYRRHALTNEKKRECLYMAILVIPPIVLGFVQAFFDKLTIFLSGVALSFIFLYLNILKYQIALDGMTGLNNRRSLNEHLLKRIDHGNADKGDLYVLLIDINAFKSINDTYGHVEGDKAICTVSALLKYCFAKTDAFISRFGGDEFAVALNLKKDDEMQKIVDRLHEPHKNWRADAQWPLSLSVGIARYDYSVETTPETLLAQADDNMYIDKRRMKRQLEEGAE